MVMLGVFLTGQVPFKTVCTSKLIYLVAGHHLFLSID